jgi:hypothetical protein
MVGNQTKIVRIIIPSHVPLHPNECPSNGTINPVTPKPKPTPPYITPESFEQFFEESISKTILETNTKASPLEIPETNRISVHIHIDVVNPIIPVVTIHTTSDDWKVPNLWSRMNGIDPAANAPIK